MLIRLEAVSKTDSTGKWKVVHLNGSDSHNHPASETPSIHPGHRRRDMQQLVSRDLSTQDLIATQTAVGISPATVMATIRQDHPDTSITAKDIANRNGENRRVALADDTPTEMLLKELTSHAFFFKYEVHSDTSRLKYLFWSHPDIKQYYKLNSNVLVMDCTYKTNMYDLPLLNIIAMANMNTVFLIAQ
ncbi:hypothetical protein PC120_g15230 [Phytophthora cactorum]|nr:hypothetical protein PC120_g15230 [Phytophthora cactorum]